MRLMVLVISRLVIRARSGMVIRYQSLAAEPGRLPLLER
jgi:hypothetical protein